MFNLRTLMAMLVAVMICSTAAFSQADDAPPEEGLGTLDLLVVDSPAFFPCPVRLPEGYDPTKEYPLVIGLHGYGANSERYLSNWFAFDEPQFIYACPQAPYPVPQDYMLGYSWFIFNTGDPVLERKSIEMAAEYVLEVLNRLEEKYSISEVYLLGFSQGAQLSMKLGIENPSQFAGAAGIAGKLETGWLAEGSLDNATGNLRVFLAHGTDDQEVPITFSYIAQDILSEKGYDVALTAFEGGHTFTADILTLFQGWIANAGHGF